jgi:hypothetical protein
MSNEITTDSTALEYANLYRKRAAQMGGTGGNKKFLNFKKYGAWELGMEAEEISPEQHLAINFTSIKHGVIGWKKKEKVWDELVALDQVPTTAAELQERDPIVKDDNNDPSGYFYQYAVDGAFIDGGLEIRINGSSTGFKNFIHRIMSDIASNLPKHPDYPNPVISLKVSHYEHKTWGRTYTSDYDLIGWCNDVFEMYEAPKAITDEAAELMK